MPLLDTDNFIVSDLTGTNYKINADDLATYMASKTGGGGITGGGGGAVPWGYVQALVNLNGTSMSLKMVGTPGSAAGSIPVGKAISESGDMMRRFYGQTVWGTSNTTNPIYFMEMNSTNPTPHAEGSLTYAFAGGLITTLLGTAASNQITSHGIGTLNIISGAFLYGCPVANLPTYYPGLTTLYGLGTLPSARNLPSLEFVDERLRFTDVEEGDYDFTNTALSAETIERWLLQARLRDEQFLGRYFKTLRFDGGTAASYEDLSNTAKEKISALQDAGYTIVMNGTGDASTINVSAGNVALIIQTSDSRYVPVKASTTAAIFPPTGYTNVTQYSLLGDAKTAMDAQVTDFDAERLYGEIQTSDINEGSVLEVNIGDAVTLDASLNNNPESATISYVWYKVVGDELVEIPGEVTATISTTSVTSAHLGVYVCELTLTHAATGRTLTLRRVFEVKEPDPAVNTSVFMS